MELTDFIKVYDDVLSKEECDKCIQIFEDGLEKKKYNTKRLKFTQYWFSGYTEFVNDIKSKMRKCHSDYKSSISKSLDYPSIFPQKYLWERFKIKKYAPELKEEFCTHIDAWDNETSTRFLSSLIYLNDVKEGGQTVFNDVTINAKAGRLLIFPPLWMFPHTGEIPTSNTKYILTTYLKFR